MPSACLFGRSPDKHVVLPAAAIAESASLAWLGRAAHPVIPTNPLTIIERADFSAAFLLDQQKAREQMHWLMPEIAYPSLPDVERLLRSTTAGRPASSPGERARPVRPEAASNLHR